MRSVELEQASFKTNKIKINYFVEHLVLIGLFGTLLLPSLNLGIAINMITIISFVLISLLPVLIYRRYIKINRFAVWYSFILILMFYSIIHCYLALDVETTYRDYMEWFRYAQVLPYLLVASLIDYKSFEQKTMTYLKVSVIYILFIAFLQITNIGNMGYFIGLVYSSIGHTESMLSGAYRIVVTGSDPNVGALIVLFLILLTFLSKQIKIYKIFQIVPLLIVLLSTQSRTVFLGLASSLFIYMLIFSKINLFMKVFVVLLISYIFYQVLQFLNLEYILIGFQMALEGTNTSLNVRFENVFLAYERFLESVALGWGPAKSIHDTVIDSEYALILQRYGLVGMFFFLGYLLLIMHFSYKLYKKKIESKLNIPLVGFLISIVGFVVMSTNTFFAGYQIVAIPTFIIISLVSYKNQMIKAENETN